MSRWVVPSEICVLGDQLAFITPYLLLSLISVFWVTSCPSPDSPAYWVCQGVCVQGDHFVSSHSPAHWLSPVFLAVPAEISPAAPSPLTASWPAGTQCVVICAINMTHLLLHKSTTFYLYQKVIHLNTLSKLKIKYI